MVTQWKRGEHSVNCTNKVSIDMNRATRPINVRTLCLIPKFPEIFRDLLKKSKWDGRRNRPMITRKL